MATAPTSVEDSGAESARREQWTLRDALTWTHQHFTRKALRTPRLDAELLLAHALGVRRLDLYLQYDRPLTQGERETYRGYIKRRLDGEPVAYIRGVKEFWSREFTVTPAVLIPRPDTEVLIEEALARIPVDAREYTVLDIGAGSGCIAVTLAAERAGVRVIATETSDDAAAVARRNADKFEVTDRVTVRAGSLYSPVQSERFDMIVSNPPYVPSAVIPTLDATVQREPHAALDGGPDGLDILRVVIADAPAHLKPGGWLLVEIGAEQGNAVRGLFSEAGLNDVNLRTDYANLPRVVMGRAA